MPGSVFIDTNVLVYSCDLADRAKCQRARDCLIELTGSGRGVVSTQVMQEFFVTATRKLRIATMTAKELLRSFAHFRLVTVTGESIMDAVDCSALHQLSFWDSLIVVAAENARCSEIWTEDLSSGQTLRGVKIVNPFA